MTTERTIQVLLVDDHEMVRCGVKTLLAGTEIKVVAEAATIQAFDRKIRDRNMEGAFSSLIFLSPIFLSRHHY